MELLLVRHGQSTWNADGRWQGQADPPLTDLGRLQAATAARSIGTVDVIVASPLDRALTTARIIADHLGVDEVTTDEDLVERCAGPWQGLTKNEIKEQWPGYLDHDQRPDGYELDPELLVRVHRALGRIREEFDGAEHVLVLTHGGVVYALEQEQNEPWLRLSNVEGRWLSSTGDRGWKLGDRVQLIDADQVELTTPSIL